MVTKEQYLEAVEIIKQYREQLIQELREVESLNETILSDIPNVKVIYTEDTKLSDVVMSTNLSNRIRYGLQVQLDELTIGSLKELSERKVLRWRNTGKKTVEELRKVLNQAGLTLNK